MFEFESHATVFTCKVSDVGVNLEMNMISRDLVESLATLFTAPTVATNTMGPQVDVDTVPGLELLATLLTAEGSLCNGYCHKEIREWLFTSFSGRQGKFNDICVIFNLGNARLQKVFEGHWGKTF